jgi:hypothetical protein
VWNGEGPPGRRRLAIIFNVGNAQPVLEMGETEAAARALGIQVVPLEIQQRDFEAAFTSPGMTLPSSGFAPRAAFIAGCWREQS